MTFKPFDIAVNEKQNHKLQEALKEKKRLTISVNLLRKVRMIYV